MANIAVVRVDFRLVHGQIVTKWRQYLNLNKCVVVDNALPNDEFMSQIYISSAPADMKVKIYSEDKAVRIWEKNQFGEGNVMLLLNNIAGCLHLAQRGVKLPAVQLGGLPGSPERTNIAKAVAINREEFEQLSQLRQEFGVEVYAQMTPEDTKVGFEDIKRKFS